MVQQSKNRSAVKTELIESRQQLSNRRNFRRDSETVDNRRNYPFSYATDDSVGWFAIFTLQLACPFFFFCFHAERERESGAKSDKVLESYFVIEHASLRRKPRSENLETRRVSVSRFRLERRKRPARARGARIVFNKDKEVGKFVLVGRKEICRREREGSMVRVASFLIARVLPTRRIRKLHSHVSAPPRDNLAS